MQSQEKGNLGDSSVGQAALKFHFYWRPPEEIRQFVDAGRQPVVLLPRPAPDTSVDQNSLVYGVKFNARVGTFCTPKSALNAPVIDWATQTLGEGVLIPLFNYDTASPSTIQAIAAAMELGVRAAASLALHTEIHPVECHMVFSSIYYDLSEIPGSNSRGYRFFAGLTFRLE